ncbi:4435_t:CDS:2, partial [Rhizophagus irregularis]
FLGVHIFPVVGGIASFYTQYFHCRDHTVSCFANQKFYIIVYEFKYSRHDEIKEMHAIYEVQFPLFHAQIMMIGLLLVAYLVGINSMNLLALTKRQIRLRDLFINFQVPLNIIFLYYSYFILKGVRDEKHYLMFIVYIGNFIQALLLYFDMASFCERYNKSVKAKYPLQCFQYNMPMCAFLLY